MLKQKKITGNAHTALGFVSPVIRKAESFLIFFLLLFCVTSALGQAHVAPHPPPIHVNKYKKKDTLRVSPYVIDTLLAAVPIKRAYFHDKIDKEQKKADDADGYPDWTMRYGGDSTLTSILTKAILHNVDHIQIMVENMPDNGRDAEAVNQQKIRSLQAVWEMMREYNSDPKPTPGFYSKLVANMHDMLIIQYA